MALPNSINKLVPDGATESARLLDDRIRNLTLALEDFFGIPDNTLITTALLAVVAAGLDEVIFSNAASNATAAGRLRRNAAQLTWHDGTSAKNVVVSSTVSPGLGVVSRQVFTASGTWTRPAGILRVYVEVIGGGGGSGGTKATDATQTDGGGGGGGGGYAAKLINVSAIASATITVGGGGSAGVAGSAAAAGQGATSSWADGTNTLSATGGGGGFGGLTAEHRPGGAGGVGSGGDINANGTGGGAGTGSQNTARCGIGGAGGSSVYGGGAHGALDGLPGIAGTAYGGGASGATNSPSTVAQAGSPGASGVVIVWEMQ